MSSPAMSAFLIPFNTPICGFFGVDGVLAIFIFLLSSSKTNTSVNVPPTSTATRYFDIIFTSSFHLMYPLTTSVFVYFSPVLNRVMKPPVLLFSLPFQRPSLDSLEQQQFHCSNIHLLLVLSAFAY